MKKKKAPKTKQDMPEFSFKEFTQEESRIYDEAVKAYREAVAAGRRLKDAYEAYAIADEDLRSLVRADFLKILIAERHFGKREAFEKIAVDLGIPVDLIKDTYVRMLQEVGETAASQFAQENGALIPEAKTND
jgi:hypothetical protein